MERLALYPGTFDPVTYGHLDVLERALHVFDRIEVTVAVNASKQTLFSIEDRVGLVQACVAGQVEVFRVVRIDPKRVVVGVHIGCVDSFPLSTTIIAA